MRMWSEAAPSGKIAIPWAVEDGFTVEEGKFRNYKVLHIESRFCAWIKLKDD